MIRMGRGLVRLSLRQGLGTLGVTRLHIRPSVLVRILLQRSYGTLRAISLLMVIPGQCNWSSTCIVSTLHHIHFVAGL
jgi:hypothetical protein